MPEGRAPRTRAADDRVVLWPRHSEDDRVSHLSHHHLTKITRMLHVHRVGDWRAWLRKHHKTSSEIWLVYYRKETGKPRISYNDAGDEALCFGWIDSTAKKGAASRTAQRFTH